MTVPESKRLALYNRLGEVLGHEYADTLMSIIQLHGELATKADLRAEIADLRAEFRSETREIQRTLRNQTYFVIGAMTALTGIFSAIVGLIT